VAHARDSNNRSLRMAETPPLRNRPIVDPEVTVISSALNAKALHLRCEPRSLQSV